MFHLMQLDITPWLPSQEEFMVRDPQINQYSTIHRLSSGQAFEYMLVHQNQVLSFPS